MNLRKIIDYLVHGRDKGRELEHLPVPLELDPAKPLDWRERKLVEARARAGRAFKCASANQDREVLVAPGEVRIIRAGMQPSQAMASHRDRERLREVPKSADVKPLRKDRT